MILADYKLEMYKKGKIFKNKNKKGMYTTVESDNMKKALIKKQMNIDYMHKRNMIDLDTRKKYG